MVAVDVFDGSGVLDGPVVLVIVGVRVSVMALSGFAVWVGLGAVWGDAGGVGVETANCFSSVSVASHSMTHRNNTPNTTAPVTINNSRFVLIHQSLLPIATWPQTHTPSLLQ